MLAKVYIAKALLVTEMNPNARHPNEIKGTRLKLTHWRKVIDILPYRTLL